MPQMSLVQEQLELLVLHPHGFSTGSEKKPGRLILRDVQTQEVTQLKHLLLANNKHEEANPAWANITDWDLRLKVDKHREISPSIHLYILLKPGLDMHMKLNFDPAKFIIKYTTTPVVGYVSLDIKQPSQDMKDTVAHIGIIIHHEVAQLKFGKEALIAILDYIFHGPVTMNNWNLGGLGLHKAFMETGLKNVAFQGLMESLHLKHLAREGTPDHGMKKSMSVPSVTYTITYEDWYKARQQVVMEWMPVGKQTHDFDGSVYFSEIGSGFEHDSGSGHASGSGSGHVPGVGLSSVHGHGVHGAHK